jgi:hypothetical protein
VSESGNIEAEVSVRVKLLGLLQKGDEKMSVEEIRGDE